MRPAGLCRAALPTRLAITRSSERRVGQHGRNLLQVPYLDLRGVGQRGRQDLLERGGAQVQGERACLQSAEVEQVLHQSVQLGHRLVGGGEELVPVLVGELHVTAAQRGDGGPAGGERGAQVVADRPQQRRTHPVGGPDRFDLGGGLGEPGPFDGGADVRGEGGEDAPLGGREGTAAQDEPGVGADGHREVTAGHVVPSGRLVDQLRRVHAEGLPGTFQQRRDRRAAAHDGAREGRHGLRLGGGAGRAP